MGKFRYFFLLLCSLTINAQQRSLKNAEIVALDFFQKKITCKYELALSSLNASSMKSKSFASADGDQPFYVFSDSINNAFIIVSGDERMHEVLAYSINSSWGCEELPIALCELLEHYKSQYNALQKGEVYRNETSEVIEIPDVSPLIKSVWDQGSPYNDKCPNKLPSGCVATAMSQVMNYHKFPLKGKGSFSYVSRTNKFNCSYNFSKSIYDWSKIRDSYATLGSLDGRSQVADLTYACGVSVGMDYDYGGSGAYMCDVPYALINFFNYNKNVTYRSRSYYNVAEWYTMLCGELENQRPVIYGGVDANMGGHAFIIDGCASKTKMFHLNWGWGGYYDGFYLLDALDPGQYKFTSGQDMVIYISADESGVHEDVFYAEKFTSSPIIFGKTTTFIVSEVYNFSNSSSYVVDYAKFNGRIGIGLFDKDFNFIKSLDEDILDELNTFYGYKEIAFNIELTPSHFASSGKYKIAPYVIAEDSHYPTRIRTLNGDTDCIEIIVNDDDIVSGDGGEDIPVKHSFFESFENMKIPDTWSQSIMYGAAKWYVNTVIFASEKKPIAADGASYACLEYSNNTLSLTKNNAATWLITDYLSLAPDSIYSIKIKARTLTESVGSVDFITLYYENEGKWELLEQFDISNTSHWQEYSTQLNGCDRTRIAIEGNVSKHGTLFLDAISVSLIESPTVIVNNAMNKEIVSIHSVTGVEYPVKGGLYETLNNCPYGLYIIRFSDFSTKIVRH